MITTLPASQMTYIATVIALVTGLMNGVAFLADRIPVLESDPTLSSWVLRFVNFLLCLAGVVGAEATLGTLDLHNWVAYVLAALGSAGASHVLYAVTTARKNAELDIANDHIDLLSSHLSAAQVAAAPDGKNGPVTPQ